MHNIRTHMFPRMLFTVLFSSFVTFSLFLLFLFSLPFSFLLHQFRFFLSSIHHSVGTVLHVIYMIMISESFILFFFVISDFIVKLFSTRHCVIVKSTIHLTHITLVLRYICIFLAVSCVCDKVENRALPIFVRKVDEVSR